jgi:ferric-dicitrate binding protein FerR (iron transport regulator)
MNDQDQTSDKTDEDDTVELLRLADPRPAVPAARAARVRTAVHREWHAGRRRRAVRTRALAAAAVLATAALLALIAGRMIRSRPAPAPGEIVARIERIDGTPRRTTIVTAAAPSTLLPNDPVRVGELIETDAYARLAVRFADGTSVRVDRGSRLQAISTAAIELTAGGVYVDVGPGATGFEVRTPVATARDIGTQFELRLLDSGVRLRTRTGLVELTAGARRVSGPAGTEVTFSATSAVSRPFARHGPEWDWTTTLAPPFEIEGLALSTFLERIAREQGWTLRYADPALAREASGIILHGSVSGLPAPQAVEIAINTSGLHHRVENGELVVLRDAHK